jgi:hypothetical protein
MATLEKHGFKSKKDISKSFADLGSKVEQERRKNRYLNDSEVVSIPSDVEGDEWAQIVKYEEQKFKEDQRREKEAFE